MKFRKRFKHTEECKLRMSKIKKEQYKNGLINGNTGKKNPELSKKQKENNISKRPEVRLKISLAMKKYFEEGNHPWNYKGGHSKNRKYANKEWFKLIKECYKRDNWTCQICNKHGGQLNAHHIIPWSEDPKKALELDNLITLCVPCHSKIHYSNTIGPINEVRKKEAREVSYENINPVR